MKSVLILHAYSSRNRGDGLLVEYAVRLAQEAFPAESVSVTVVARDCDSFSHLDVELVDALPRGLSELAAYARTLKRIANFDLILGVGGGYLRFGTPTEAMKAAVVHLPQLLATRRSSGQAVYLPQSVGPLRFGTRPIVQHLLGRTRQVFVRDDRSASDLTPCDNVVREPDLAIVLGEFRRTSESIDPVPVLTVRSVGGGVPHQVRSLASAIGVFDGYVQSSVGGNDDREAMRSLGARQLLDESELMAAGAAPRVVIAVRLHAALIALHNGHFVIHLAYERKGFGAFEDLGLLEYVHPVGTFAVSEVREQAQKLVTDTRARQEYDGLIQDRSERLAGARDRIVGALRSTAGART
ncbi:polysaccharide pyruvyl transferase family protein [Gordonia soli NBRC 108243]|uniref:Polysaccharide pyruvyl transferase family protein n=1 Tax=Gordonia soli NBRC 108243 TaxID=1223545 RepID=M0QJ61_9ACTN|nr:polysaccharide pyruvyl transferase family protein [Gordonia soli NBRC 108243]